jgi:hypothetical protein
MKKPSPTVYAFMDESGDAGSSVRKGASPHFVLVLVETTDPEQLHIALDNLREKLNLARHFEFHYHKTQMSWARAGFFALLRSLDVRVRAAVLDKTKLTTAERWRKQQMYEYILSELVKRSAPSDLHDAILVIDGERQTSNEPFLRGLRQAMTRLGEMQHRGRIFKSIVLKEAKREDGLQFADMIAGAIADGVKHGESPYDLAIAEKLAILLTLP